MEAAKINNMSDLEETCHWTFFMRLEQMFSVVHFEIYKDYGHLSVIGEIVEDLSAKQLALNSNLKISYLIMSGS